MLPFDLRSRVDLGPAFKSLGWNKRGEKVSEGGLELVTATCLDAAAGGCAYPGSWAFVVAGEAYGWRSDASRFFRPPGRVLPG